MFIDIDPYLFSSPSRSFFLCFSIASFSCFCLLFRLHLSISLFSFLSLFPTLLFLSSSYSSFISFLSSPFFFVFYLLAFSLTVFLSLLCLLVSCHISGSSSFWLSIFLSFFLSYLLYFAFTYCCFCLLLSASVVLCFVSVVSYLCSSSYLFLSYFLFLFCSLPSVGTHSLPTSYVFLSSLFVLLILTVLLTLLPSSCSFLLCSLCLSPVPSFFLFYPVPIHTCLILRSFYCFFSLVTFIQYTNSYCLLYCTLSSLLSFTSLLIIIFLFPYLVSVFLIYLSLAHLFSDLSLLLVLNTSYHPCSFPPYAVFLLPSPSPTVSRITYILLPLLSSSSTSTALPSFLHLALVSFFPI